MTIDEKKDYLNQYRNEYNKLKSLEEQKKSIIADALNVKAQSYSDMPKSGIKTDLSDTMVQLERIMNEIDTQVAECIAIKIKIESAILHLKNGNECIVLRDKYINFQKWEKIAERMNYSLRQIYTFHGHALQHIDL